MKIRKKRKKKFKFLKILLIVITLFIGSKLLLKSIYNNLNMTNEEFINLLLNDSKTIDNSKLLNTFVKLISNIDFTNPVSVLSMNNDIYSFNNYEDNYNIEELKNISEYIEDPNKINISSPRVYIYNSHQLENYNNDGLEIYNITPNVMMASYLLKEKLNTLSIPTIVETTNMVDFMNANAWVHADSYKASRILILDAKNKYDSIEYYIDLHRDSISKDLTTITINKKGYAKLLFVVGLENPNYEKNLRLANELSSKINSMYKGLSKGVLKKQGAGVDGVYNQDINPNMMLLEVGGVYNNIDEVLNSIEAFSICFNEFIKEYE